MVTQWIRINYRYSYLVICIATAMEVAYSKSLICVLFKEFVHHISIIRWKCVSKYVYTSLYEGLWTTSKVK